MLKVLVLPALLILLSAVACSFFSPLSLEDYADECGEWRDDYGDIGSASVSDIEGRPGGTGTPSAPRVR